MLMTWWRYQEQIIQFSTMEKIMQACKIFAKMIIIKMKKIKWSFNLHKN